MVFKLNPFKLNSPYNSKNIKCFNYNNSIIKTKFIKHLIMINIIKMIRMEMMV